MKILKRTLTALATAALVVCALLWLPQWALKCAVIALATLVHLEFSQMVSRKYPIMVWPGVAAGLVYLVSGAFFYDNCFVPLMFALALFALFGKSEKPVAAWATTLLGFIYIPVMMSFFMKVCELDGAYSPLPLLYVISIVKISDMGGFAFGLAFGKHKMCPEVSPKKSWEGFAGSVFGSCLISALFMPLTGFSFALSLLLGVAAATFGTLGDLVESRLKRECGVKDSATFMPAGMGGFLDMLDSLLFAPALFCSFLPHAFKVLS